MDEYFCPNCGAILNEQYGFAPDGGTWRCTECGELLVDDDVYNGDSFEGIAWYCDSCGALLNRQCGFSDSYGSWTCTECGHHNRISEDDIVSEEQIEFSCPNCGVALDFQPGFNKYDDDWECSSCGAHLHHSYSDDEYTIIKHICPRCDAPLDIQWGFNEDDENWECTECGAHLYHDYYDEYEEREEESSNNSGNLFEYSDSENQHYSYSNTSSDSARTRNNESHNWGSHVYSDNKVKQKTEKKANRKLRFLGILFLIAAALIGIGYYEIKLLTPVGFSSTELRGESYEEVISAFEKEGFSNILTNEIADLSLKDIAEENKVDTVKIGIFDKFTSISKYPSNFPVLITYHTLEKYSVPMSSKEAKGANYQDVMGKFEEAGFENITLEVEYDIITGWITDDGKVKSVTVNDDGKFASGKEYRADVEVVITYHTYRSNKSK